MNIRNTIIAMSLMLTGCIEPPLNLPGEEVIIDAPAVEVSLDVIWNIDTDWKLHWFYDWDSVDKDLWGPIEYPMPTSYEVRRYFLGNTPGVPHTEVDGFTIFGKSFRKYYNFGYYDMLIWSNIDSKDGTQTVIINESNLDEVRATTTGTRGMRSIESLVEGAQPDAVTGLYNQPEIFYSTYPQDIYISRRFEDYDYYDEKENVWVKHLNAELNPLVYIYLVQIIIYDNDGRIVGVNGNNSISGFASSTSVNTGQTGASPGMIYFESRMKTNKMVNDRRADIIGGKFTTYGLCDMPPFAANSRAEYTGSRSDVINHLFFDLLFANGKVKTFQADVTRQCQAQCHGGVITIELNARDIPVPPDDDKGSGSLFIPTVEDYNEVEWEVTF